MKPPSKAAISSLVEAVKDGDLEMIQSLLQQNPHLLDKCKTNSPNGFILEEEAYLHHACRFGHLPIVKFFVEQGASVEGRMRFKNNGAQDYCLAKPLLFAVSSGFAEIVSFLIKQQVNIEERPLLPGGALGVSPLEKACHKNRLQVARVLLKAGAKGGGKLFRMVCNKGFLDLAKLLVEFNVHGEELDKDIDGSALHDACASGNEKLVEWLLDQGASVETGARSTTKSTPLMVCCQYGKVEAARVMIHRGANVSARGANGMTPLDIACFQGGPPEIIEMLLDNGADVETPAAHGLTPLQVACSTNACSREVISLLIDRGANIETRDDSGFTALYFATLQKNLDAIDLLLSRGADPAAMDNEGQTIVILAVTVLEVGRVFFKHKTNATSTDGVTQLHIASAFGLMTPTLGLLRDKKSVIHYRTREKGKTPLHLASEFGHLPIVQVLVNQKAKLEAKDKEKWTALHWACGKGYTQMVETLLDKGAEDIEAKQRHGWTALHLACQNGKVETVGLLIDRGSNIHAGGTNGWTALHISSKFGNLRVTRFLLDKDADVNSKNAKGWTPLYVACMYGRLKTARCLLRRGADMTVRGNGGKTAEQVARKRNHTEIAELLASWKKH